ncbi:MAG: tryptophan-rich sensory protein [Chthoniobacteraceae bacterium]|nr:tryptophan-rich sensory protein [Chthoniobacteraceae bacterium]
MLAGWILLTFLAPTIGAGSLPGEWFAGLNKPSWNPPSALFGPVWTLLYILMAVAAWRVWRQGGWRTQRRPLTFYLIQLALNAFWTPLFFGWHLPGVAFGEIILLWVAIVITLVAFSKVERPATWLLVPYLAWVSFAAVLNLSIWRLNPPL